MEANISSQAFQPHEEDQLRASVYGFLAATLSHPPSAEILDIAKSFSGDETQLGKAFNDLSIIAKEADLESVEREHHDLFIGLSRGELLPFASYYLTGFLNEKPLAKLRNTLVDIGIERTDDTREPEDHIGALCDIMSGLITGRFSAPATLEVQKKFFSNHISNWAPHFFKDLVAAQNAKFYKPIGRIGQEFMLIEASAFGMS